jgi:hypothetical protein
MAFRRGRAQAREQAFFIEKRNRRYKLLNDKIFKPLVYKSLKLGNDRSSTNMGLSYDISEITNSFYYKEAKEHLKGDLPEELVKPEDLHDEVPIMPN